MSASSLPHLAEDGEPFDLDGAYRAHRRWLIAFLRRRFGAQDAEDLAQEVYLRVSAARLEIRNPRAFLAKVALNTARDQARRRAARPRLVSERLCTPPICDAGQAEALLLKQAILSLPTRLRDVFVLNRFEGLTYAEIAQRYGLSVKTVEGRMTQALAICAALMEQESTRG